MNCFLVKDLKKKEWNLQTEWRKIQYHTVFSFPAMDDNRKTADNGKTR